MSETLKIGVALPLTGDQSPVGRAMADVISLGVDHAQAAGVALGLRVVDDEGSPDTAKLVARTLVEDIAVIAIVGHKNSEPSVVAAPIYCAARLAQVSQSSTDDALTSSGWDTAFRMCASNRTQAERAADFAVTELRAERTVAIHDGTAYGRPLVEAFTARLRERGRETLPDIAVRVGQTDFSDAVALVTSSQADVCFIGATEVEASLVARAIRAAGLSIQLMSAEGGPDNPFPALAGAAGEGSINTYAGVDPNQSEAGAEFRARCSRAGLALSSFGLECFDASQLVAAAIRDGVGTREEMRSWIARCDFNGLTGAIRFSPQGDRTNAEVSLWRIESGRSVHLQGAG
jgi:branched-chain amino acid transport system substrate-binding protein